MEGMAWKDGRFGRRWVLTRLAALGAVSTLDISSEVAAAQTTTVGELGTASSNQSHPDTWHTLSFDDSYSDPIVIMGPLSEHGSHPAHVRLRNVSSDRAEWKIEEWDYLDGSHTKESVSYLVTESGRSSVGGTPIQAGIVNTDDDWTSVTFDSPFERTPVILVQSQTYNGYDSITTRLTNVSETGFTVRMQESERMGPHTTETVGYVAIGGDLQDRFEVGTVTTDETWASPSVSESFDSPVFIASMQTANGGNTAGLRHQNLTESSVDVRVEEEQSADEETNHCNETIGYLFGTSGFLTDTSADGPAPGAYFAQHVGEDPTQAYENWLDRTMLVSDHFIHKESHYRNMPDWKIDPWTKWLNEDENRRLAWALKLGELVSLETGANGEANDIFRSFGETLVSEGHEDASLRIAAEFDLKHTINPSTDQERRWFVEYWREIVDTLRSVDGQQFDIVWNPNYSIATDEWIAEQTWPGDTYVDTVGVDIYDLNWAYYDGDSEPTQADHENAWADSNRYLDWFRQWADDHHKPLAVPEWGVWSRADHVHAGGDNPYFIQQMHEWMHENDVVWQVYFEDMEIHSLSRSDTLFPESAAKFKQLFG